MRSVGVDVASTGFSGIALAIDGVPKRATVWKPSNIKDSPSVHLVEFHTWLKRQFWALKPDIIAVEELAVFQSKTVIRALARHEGVALLTAKQTKCIVVSPGVSTSRSIVFPKSEFGRKQGKGGSISKDDAWKFFKQKYPDFETLSKTSGGTDQMDAMVHALAAPVVLERR